MLVAVAAIGDDQQKKQVDVVVGDNEPVDTPPKKLSSAPQQLAVREIEQYVSPLALLLAHNGSDVNFALRFGFTSLLRDFWLNCVIHGIYYSSDLAKKHANSLKTIARYTPPLIDGAIEDRHFDASLDDRSLLKRRIGGPQAVVEHKRRLINLIPAEELHIRTLTYERTVFVEATHFLECMRAEGGGCSKVLAYFVEPAFKTGDAASVMVAIASKATDTYIARIFSGVYPEFSASRVADQLADVFVGCCHRLEKVQKVATTMADRIVAAAPSALCRKLSLFALLELLTLLWASCLREEIDEYATKSIFASERGGRVAIEMPDSYKFRQQTLNNFHAKARSWVLSVGSLAGFDLKGLLQTYLSEFDDQGSLGRISLGRTFALQMGTSVPGADRRLGTSLLLGNLLYLLTAYHHQLR